MDCAGGFRFTMNLIVGLWAFLIQSACVVVRDLGKTKSCKQKAAKEARKIMEMNMKGKQIKDELSLAMIQLFTNETARRRFSRSKYN